MEAIIVTKECSNCGAQMEENIKFCTDCGSKMEPEELKCPTCAIKLPEGTKFCMECGTKIGTTPEPKPKVQAAPKEVTCPKCQKKLPTDLKFCTECGTSLGSPAPKKNSGNEEVDKLLNEAKVAGKGIMKEADGLLKRFMK